MSVREWGFSGEILGERLDQLGEQLPGSAEFESHQPGLQPPEDSTGIVALTEGIIELLRPAWPGERHSPGSTPPSATLRTGSNVSIVRSRPSRRFTVGSQSRTLRAFEMSG